MIETSSPLCLQRRGGRGGRAYDGCTAALDPAATGSTGRAAIWPMVPVVTTTGADHDLLGFKAGPIRLLGPIVGFGTGPTRATLSSGVTVARLGETDAGCEQTDGKVA